MDDSTTTRARAHWAGGGWFAVPFAFFDGGTLAKLSRAELLVLLGLMRHAGHATGTAWPGVDRLAEAARLSTRTVRRALAELRAVQLAELVEPGGGRKHAAVYRLRNPDAGVRVCGHETLTAGAPETRTAKARNPDGRHPKACHPRQPNKSEQSEQANSNNAAVAAGMREALQRQGIAEPKLSELVEGCDRWRLTPAAVEAIAERTRQRSGGTGLVIREIEAEITKAAARACDERHRAELRSRIEVERRYAEEQQTLRDAEAREERERIRKRRDALWATLTGEDVARLRAEIVADLERRGERQRAAEYRKADPARWPSLRNAILDRAERAANRSPAAESA